MRPRSRLLPALLVTLAGLLASGCDARDAVPQADLDREADALLLRELEGLGNDLGAAMEIEFFVALPERPGAERFAGQARALGWDVVIDGDMVEGGFVCTCTRAMVASAESLGAARAELAPLAAAEGGAVDGWGTLGNAPSDAR